MKKAVVLLSGGLDSTTALYWAKAKGYKAICLSIQYGQRHRRELIAARKIARLSNSALHEVDIKLPWLKDSSLVNKALRLPNLPLARIGKGPIPTTYVPGRNTIFLALAASLADAAQADAVVIGANALDYSGYPDCRGGYLRAMERALRAGTRRPALKLLAPLLSLDKAGIWRLGGRVGAPLDLTWSCYAGGRTPCGRCDSCKLREKGFDEAFG